MATFQNWHLVSPGVWIKMTHFILSIKSYFFKFSFYTKYGYIHRLTPSKFGIEAGGEWDPFMSYNVQDLFKTFKLIPNMATFRGWPLVSPLGWRSGWPHFKTTMKSYFLKVFIKIFNLIPNMAIFTGWPPLTPFQGGVEAWGEWDPFKSYHVPDLFKTFHLIPNMATFQDWPLLTQLGLRIRMFPS